MEKIYAVKIKKWVNEAFEKEVDDIWLYVAGKVVEFEEELRE